MTEIIHETKSSLSKLRKMPLILLINKRLIISRFTIPLHGKSQRTARYTSATFLANSKIPTYIDDQHAIAHNKIMIIDGTTVITGSFNFTKAAEEKNAENLVIIKSRELGNMYAENWKNHKEHSEPYEPRY